MQAQAKGRPAGPHPPLLWREEEGRASVVQNMDKIARILGGGGGGGRSVGRSLTAFQFSTTSPGVSTRVPSHSVVFVVFVFVVGQIPRSRVCLHKRRRSVCGTSPILLAVVHRTRVQVNNKFFF